MKFILTLLLTYFGSNLSSQDMVESLIQKNLLARGGIMKLEKLTSLKMELIETNAKVETPISITIKQNIGYKKEYSTATKKNYVEIINQKNSGISDPSTGIKGFMIKTPIEHESLKYKMNVHGWLAPKRQEGCLYEYSGEEESNGIVYSIITIRKTANPGESVKIFINQTTFLIYKEVYVNQDLSERVYTFSDYKMTPDGYSFPMTLGTPQGEIKVKTIKINPMIDNNIFNIK